MSYKIIFTKQAEKDYEKVKKSPYHKKVKTLISTVREEPLKSPVEKLVDQKTTYSRRINVQHRFVYEILEEEKTVKIISMWTHYENV